MVATISAAADQYHHSINTLKYADRAKEIKTHVVQNVGSVERHVADYKSIIDNLQVRCWASWTRGVEGLWHTGRTSTA
jgi:kinesin family protein 18/19